MAVRDSFNDPREAAQYTEHRIGHVVRYKKLDHAVDRPLKSIDVTTGVTLYSDTMVVTRCGSMLLLNARRKTRAGVPTCVQCLAKRPA